MAVAIINLLAEGADAVFRLILSREATLTPDMVNHAGNMVSFAIMFFRLLSICLAFFLSRRKISAYRKLIPEEDEKEMARLQEEMIPDKVSTLTVHAIEQLLKIWAAILIGVEIVYEITSVAYQNFIVRLTDMITITDPEMYLAYVALYNSTHGFKYVGMLIAICIGIFTTGIFLKDKVLVGLSAFQIAFFLAAFLLIQSSTVVLPTRTVGIVWTSVIFHVLQTIGLFVFAFYIRRKYRGM